jgi:EmrB/QacA subfamily drug resistance transporter
MIMLFAGVLMGALDISIVGPAIPSIEKALNLTDKDLTWIYSIYILLNLVGISFMAKLSDLYGRRSIYTISLAIFGAGSLMVSLSHNITLLLIGRAVQGFGSSGIFPVASATIGDVFPAGKRGRALGLLGAVFGLAFILGPFIAGFMLMYFDWNALFLINIPVSLVLMVFAMRLLPGRKEGPKVGFDWVGIVLMGIVLTSFALAMNNLDTRRLPESFADWNVLPFLLLMAILTPLLMIAEKTQEDPVLNMKLFRSRQVRFVGFISIGVGLFQSCIVFLPKLAVDIFRVTPSSASFMLLPLVLATAVGSPVNGRLVDAFGSRVVIITGMLLTGLSLFMLSLIKPELLIFYLAGAILGLGLSVRASLNYIMLNEVDSRDRASTQGMLIIFISIGQIAGAAFFGAVTSAFPDEARGYGISYLLMAGIAMILFLLAFFLKTRKGEQAMIKIADMQN